MALLIIGTMSTPARGTVASLTSLSNTAANTFSAGKVLLTPTGTGAMAAVQWPASPFAPDDGGRSRGRSREVTAERRDR